MGLIIKYLSNGGANIDFRHLWLPVRCRGVRGTSRPTGLLPAGAVFRKNRGVSSGIRQVGDSPKSISITTDDMALRFPIRRRKSFSTNWKIGTRNGEQEQ